MIHVLSRKFIHKEKVIDGIENIQTSYTMTKVKLKDVFSSIASATKAIPDIGLSCDAYEHKHRKRQLLVATIWPPGVEYNIDYPLTFIEYTTDGGTGKLF